MNLNYSLVNQFASNVMKSLQLRENVKMNIKDKRFRQGFFMGQHTIICDRCSELLSAAMSEIVSGCPDIRKSMREMKGN